MMYINNNGSVISTSENWQARAYREKMAWVDGCEPDSFFTTHVFKKANACGIDIESKIPANTKQSAKKGKQASLQGRAAALVTLAHHELKRRYPQDKVSVQPAKEHKVVLRMVKAKYGSEFQEILEKLLGM